jgi:hypothetical protein
MDADNSASGQESIRAVSVPRFDLQTQRDEILAYIEENGYVIIQGVLNEEEIAEGKKLFWNYIDGRETELDRRDLSTWKIWPGDSQTGIISGEINHSDFLWHVRLNPQVKKAFELLWDTNDLLTSFDGGNAFRPWNSGYPKYKTRGGWWHVDQNCLRGLERQGRVSIQGLVTFYDADETTGGFTVIPGSHQYHEIICQQAPRKIDFIPILGEFPEELKVLPHSLPRAKAGDLILWDSRTVHCNVPAFAPVEVVPSPVESDIKESEPIELLRLVAYVCMQPRSMATQAAIASKRLGMLYKIPTSHWATKEIDADLLEYSKKTFSQSKSETMQTASEEKMRLSGFSEEEIQNRCLKEDSTGFQSCTIN